MVKIEKMLRMSWEAQKVPPPPPPLEAHLVGGGVLSSNFVHQMCHQGGGKGGGTPPPPPIGHSHYGCARYAIEIRIASLLFFLADLLRDVPILRERYSVKHVLWDYVWQINCLDVLLSITNMDMISN